MRELGILELRSPIWNRAKPHARRVAPRLHKRPAMTKHLLLLLSLAGCEKDLLAGMDAGPDTQTVDAPPPTSCPAVTTHPLPPGRFKLYVNTEGVSLTKCSTDDAPTNCASALTGNVTIPAFLPGDPNRQPFIDAIVVRVQEKLAPYSIDVVTTRPTSGEYAMDVVGGDATLVGATPQTLAIGPTACSFDNHNHVAFTFDRGEAAGYNDYAWSIVSDFALGAGVAATATTNDCACRSGNCGNPETAICNWGVDVPVVATPPNDCGRTTQDEPMLLAAALGCR